MPTVFIVQTHTQRDFKEAEVFGELAYMCRHHLNKMEPDILAAWDKSMDEALHEFLPEQDFVLLTGDPVAIALAGAKLCEATLPGTPVKFLKWSNLHQEYQVIEVIL